MTVPTGTWQSFSVVGIREDLSDTIQMINQHETPLYSRFKKGKCDNRTPEWIIDTRRAANASNAVVEGSNATNLTPTTPTRVKNVVQLFEGAVQVSTTAMAVKAAGRTDEMDYQIAKEGLALRTDIEKRISGNYASVVGNASTAGEMAGFEAWITTNDNRGTGAAAQGGWGGTVVAAATDGTTRALTEAIFKSAIKTCWSSGAEIPLVVTGAFNKQTISGFAGIAQATNEVKSSDLVTILGAADVYVSDYGRHAVVPSRFSRDASVLLVNPKMWDIEFLQPFKRTKLAQTGHSMQEMLSAECTLRSRNEAENGIISDLTTS